MRILILSYDNVIETRTLSLLFWKNLEAII